MGGQYISCQYSVCATFVAEHETPGGGGERGLEARQTIPYILRRFIVGQLRRSKSAPAHLFVCWFVGSFVGPSVPKLLHDARSRTWPNTTKLNQTRPNWTKLSRTELS